MGPQGGEVHQADRFPAGEAVGPGQLQQLPVGGPEPLGHVLPHHREDHQPGDHRRDQVPAGPQQHQQDEGDHRRGPDDPNDGGEQAAAPGTGAGEGGQQDAQGRAARHPRRDAGQGGEGGPPELRGPGQAEQGQQHCDGIGEEQLIAPALHMKLHQPGPQLPDPKPEGRGQQQGQGAVQTVRIRHSRRSHRGARRRWRRGRRHRGLGNSPPAPTSFLLQ